jgi:hypothetical protein
MRMAGIVMLVLGLIALVFAVVGALGDRWTGDNLPFLSNSWFIIMAIFWGGAGISVLLTFGKSEKEY